MNEHVIDDGLARKFLLGQLSPEEQGRIEERAFADPDVFAFLQATEDDLMDEFLYGDLSSEEKKSFEKFFLHRPGRRQDLRIARALRRYLDHENEPLEVVAQRANVSFWQRLGLSSLTGPLAAAAIIIVAIAVLLLVIRAIRRDEAPIYQAQQQQPTPVSTPTSSATETPVVSTPTPVEKGTPVKPSPSPRQTSVPVFAILTPGAPTRSESDKTVLPFPSGAAPLELPVIRETGYRTYQALLQKDEQTIHTWNNLHLQKGKSGKAVVVTVRAGMLEKSKRYRIVLNGVSSSGKTQQLHTYHFQVSDTEIR